MKKIIYIAALLLCVGLVFGLGSENRVKNSEFNGATDWTFYTNGAGSATFNGMAEIGIVSRSSNTQLYQTGILLKPNTNYVMELNAKSKDSGDMTVKFLKHTSPYTSYATDWSIDLTSNWKKYVRSLKTNNNAANDTRLMFWLVQGANGEKYSIDNITLVENLTNTPSTIKTRIGYQVTDNFNFVPGRIMYPSINLIGYYNITDSDINEYGYPDSYDMDCNWYANGVLSASEEISHYNLVIGSEQRLELPVDSASANNWKLVCNIAEYEPQPQSVLINGTIIVSNISVCGIGTAPRICQPQQYHATTYDLYECSNNKNHFDFIQTCGNGCSDGVCINQ